MSSGLGTGSLPWSDEEHDRRQSAVSGNVRRCFIVLFIVFSVEAGRGNQPRPASVSSRHDGIQCRRAEEIVVMDDGVETPSHKRVAQDN